MFTICKSSIFQLSKNAREFPGGPVVKTSSFQCNGPEFDPWSGNYDPTCCTVQLKKKKHSCLAAIIQGERF